MPVDDIEKQSFNDGTAPKAQPEDTSDVGSGAADGTTPLNPKGDTAAVQFIPGNGDHHAKVEIGDTIPVAFIGLGKEELMKYANDPFWVRLRWFLFILFWLIWLAMLIGAIVIIVLAPKCKEPKSITEQIVENGPFYQINLKQFTQSGDLKGLKEKSSYIKDLGMSTVIISDIVDKTDLYKVNGGDGSLTELKQLVDEFKKNGIKVLLQFVPNHSAKDNKWFTEHPEYYVLLNKDEAAKSNWKTVPNPSESAWSEVGENSTDSYLHLFGKDNPDFNYKNDDVSAKMNDILKHWYKETGVEGFLLSEVSYLKENLKDLENQNATINQEENKEIVKKMLNSKEWEIEDDRHVYAILEVDDLSAKAALAQYGGKIFTPIVSVDIPSNFNVQELKDEFSSIGQYVIRRLSSQKGRLNSKYTRERGNILALMSYLVNGQVILYYGDESGSRNQEIMFEGSGMDSSLLEYYKKLGTISAMVTKSTGDKPVDLIIRNDTDILAFQRGDHIAVVSLSGQRETVDIKALLKIEDAGMFHKVLTTPGGTAEESPQGSGNFTLTPVSGVVFHFAKDAPTPTTA